MSEPKLDIHATPERFGHLERAMEMARLVSEEHHLGFPVDDSLCGVKEFSGSTEEKAFLEGYFLALAFCSGAVSGGKVREFARWAQAVDEFTLNSWADASMKRQTLFEQNPEVQTDSGTPTPTNFVSDMEAIRIGKVIDRAKVRGK